MRYYKFVVNGIIISFGIGNGGKEIAEEEYIGIQNALENKPEPSEDTDYMLMDDLTWREYAIDPVDPEIDDSELLSILLGGDE